MSAKPQGPSVKVESVLAVDDGEAARPSVKEDRRADGTPETRAMVERAPVAKTKGCMSADLPKECECMAHGRMKAKLQRHAVSHGGENTCGEERVRTLEGQET